MDVHSEKVFYEKDVIEALRTLDADVILWGEDLYDARIVLYPKKITALQGYAELKSRLINAGLVYFNFKAEHFIKSTVVRWDEGTRTVYIAEGNFNAVWKYLRKSVELGIRMKQKSEEKISVEKAEDIVDLSYLQRKGSKAVLRNGQLVYEERELPESEIKALGRKQSALDNQKNKYFYSDLDDRYHDKDCELIKKIPAVNFLASDNVPEGYKPCRKCCRRIFLREACAPYVRQIRIVDHMLMKQGITDFYLEKCAFDYGFKFRIDNEGELTVTGKEDTWIIKGFDKGQLSLWHNNYVRIALRERYITSGFHNQGVEGKKLYALLEYINGYEFEKHLVSEESVAREQLAEEQTAGERKTETLEIENREIMETGNREDERQNLVSRFKSFVKRLLGRQ